MGGIGSGGQNRLSPDEHKRRGTFQPSRHANRVGEIVPFVARRDIPRAPQGLGAPGKRLWRELWGHMPNIGPLEASLIEVACQLRDQVELTYVAWQRVPTADNAKAMFDAQKSWRQQLVVLGLGARERQALTAQKPPKSSIDTFKSKVLELKQSG